MKPRTCFSRTRQSSYYLAMDRLWSAVRLLYRQKDTGFAMQRRSASIP